jgi:DNA-binding NtrC family response regulator
LFPVAFQLLRKSVHETVVSRPVLLETEYCGMSGRSPAMQEVFSLIRRLAPHATVVLVSGETGTGKELAARAFHQAGPRRAKAVCDHQLLGRRGGSVRLPTQRSTGPFTSPEAHERDHR